MSAAPEIYRGLAGRLAELCEPYTEADPVAIALQFLVAFGNAVGRSPCWLVGETPHRANEFLLLVGQSSKSRKGDSRNLAYRPLKLADPDWYARCVKGGASTGEGLIYHVRDEVRAADDDGAEKIVDPGAEDKRLLVSESEFATVLKRAAQRHNTLSTIMRDGWDGTSPLATLTKHHSVKATDAHISVIAHCTPADLHTYLSDCEAANGFGNRFLIVEVDRSKLLPSPAQVPAQHMQQLAEELKAVLLRVGRIERLQRSPEFEESWAGIYPYLSEAKPGLIGSLVARAEAHVLRLSILYALLDASSTLRQDHLEAALGVWDICESSIRNLFSGRTGNRDADRVLEAVQPGAEATLTQLREEEFGGHISSDRLNAALHLVVGLGFGRVDKRFTSGRPQRVFCRNGPEKGEKPGGYHGIEEPRGFSGFSSPRGGATE